ncbi:hypothetical protein, partial [Pseudomonas protegens]|uniref:hypothetical protein n=1 Tax=Pseudomonas protegens TaxID=380021 RepID=UPI000A8D2F71
MLSLMYPQVMRIVSELSVGLYPFTAKADSIPKLIVKVSKEVILTAKVRQGFSIYLIPYEHQGFNSLGFLAAFFDDERHPYTAGGVFVKEIGGRELSRLFVSPQIDVHFFDELGREYLAYRAEVKFTKEHRELLKRSVIPSIQGLNQSVLVGYLKEWFSRSGEDEDAAAIKVNFLEPLMVEDLIIFDMREDLHTYKGSSGFTALTLERDEPGTPQEKEIITLLQRTFEADQIYWAPRRTYDNEEMVDVLVVTSSSVFLIQAKDSPNLEETLDLSIEKKRSATNRALKKGLRQVSGALGYLRRSSPFIVLMEGEQVMIDVADKKVYGLVVVRELFDFDYDDYTPPMLNFYNDKQVPCIPLSYSELHQYTKNIDNEQGFLEAIMKVFNHGVETGMFPRLRMHPP